MIQLWSRACIIATLLCLIQQTKYIFSSHIYTLTKNKKKGKRKANCFWDFKQKYSEIEGKIQGYLEKVALDLVGQLDDCRVTESHALVSFL